VRVTAIPFFAFVVAVPVRADVLGDQAVLRKQGLAALPLVLRHVDSENQDVRLRARHLALSIARDHFRSLTPEGMCLVPPDLLVTSEGVRADGGLYLAVHEVTVAEFRLFLRATKREATRWEKLGAGRPVTRVSLKEARAYATWRKARVPTQAELKRAVTNGGRTRYPWGETFDPRRVNGREAGLGHDEAPGARRLGTSSHGIADLLGNVAEWTETSSQRRTLELFHVVGGSYLHPTPKGTGFVTYRLGPGQRLDDVGFRIARSLPPLKS